MSGIITDDQVHVWMPVTVRVDQGHICLGVSVDQGHVCLGVSVDQGHVWISALPHDQTDRRGRQSRGVQRLIHTSSFLLRWRADLTLVPEVHHFLLVYFCGRRPVNSKSFAPHLTVLR